MANQSLSQVSPPTCAFVFQKRFISGHLAGLVVADYISFANADLRRNWLKAIRANRGLDWALEGEVLAYDASFSREEAIADYKLWAN